MRSLMIASFAGLALVLIPLIGFAQNNGPKNPDTPPPQQQNQPNSQSSSQTPPSSSAQNQIQDQNSNQDQSQAQQPEAPSQQPQTQAPTQVQSQPQARRPSEPPPRSQAQQTGRQPQRQQTVHTHTHTVIRKSKTTRQKTQTAAQENPPTRRSGSSNSSSTSSRLVPGAAGTASMSPTLAGRITPLLQDRISLERTELQRQVRTVAEALSAVEETRSAVGFLNSQNTDRANVALTNALAKVETLLAQHSDLSLVPIITEVRVMDFVSDPKMVNSVTQDARALVTVGRFQAARRLLRNFASEINIETTSIPMATYPNAIREAGRLLKQGKAEEAKADLIAALNTLVITEKSVPLPLIKAQALVDEVNRGVLDKSMNKTEANQLLTEATSQLQMAQAMGYGSGPQDFIALQNNINQIQKNLNQNQDSRSQLARLRNDFESLKKRTL